MLGATTLGLAAHGETPPGLERLRVEAAVQRLADAGRRALDAGDWSEARERFREVVALDREHPQAPLGHVLVEARRGELAAAPAALESFIAPGGPAEAYGLGLVAFLEGDLADAESRALLALRGYLARDHPSGEAAARTLLGNVYLRTARLEEAAREYEVALARLEALGDRHGIADLLDNLGSVELRRGRVESAIEIQRRSLASREAAGDRAGLARSWNNIALSLKTQGDREGAREAFERALALQRELGDRAGEARCRVNLGHLYLDQSERGKAIEQFGAAEAAARETGDRRTRANALTGLGLGHKQGRDLRQAVSRLTEALGVWSEIGDRANEAAALNNLALAHEAGGHWSAALPLYDRAAELHESGDDRAGLALVHGNAGNLLRKMGRLEESAKRLRAAEASFADTGDASGRAGALTDLGETLLAAGESDGARTALESAVSIGRSAGDHAVEAAALDRLGVLHTHLGEFETARATLDLALARAGEADDAAREAAVRNDLATLELRLGHPTQALRLQDEALRLQLRAGDVDAQITSLNNLGAIYQSLGERDSALRHLGDALVRARESQDRASEAMVRNNLGVLLLDMGRLGDAATEQRVSLEIRRALGDARGAAFTQYNLAETLRHDGRVAEAKLGLERALAEFRRLGYRPGEAFTSNALGDLARDAGDPATALGAYRRALDVASASGLVEEEAFARHGIGTVHEARGEPGTALHEYLKALDIVDTIRGRLVSSRHKSLYVAARHRLYESATLLLARQGKGEQAFAVVERARARGLLDLLSEARADLRRRVPVELSVRETVLKDRIRGALARLQDSSDDHDVARAKAALEIDEEALRLVEIEIRRSAPHYGELVRPAPATPRQVQESVLGQGEALLAYSLGDDASVVWLVERNGSRFALLPGRDTIERRVTAFLDALRSPGADLDPADPVARRGEELARLVVPFDDLGRVTRLLIAPDGLLHHVPFEALRLDGRYVIERHEVTYVPSAATLRQLRQQRPERTTLDFLGIADPKVPPSPDGSPPLPFSREEVSRVARLFPPQTSRLLLGEQATLAGFRAAGPDRYRVLHFATHARTDEEVPERSRVLLSPPAGSTDPGFLTMNEILGLDLGGDLAVLSACRSGRGRLVRGEGIVGLTGAFLYAGSRAVLVSLWDVGDRSTADLMEELYRRLIAGDTISGALRRAKLALLSSPRPGYRNAARWAPFVLVGDPAVTLRANSTGRSTTNLDGSAAR